MSARSLNRVMLIGNLTRDPELRYTPSGTAVCTFGLATNRSWTPTDGTERQEETEYHRIVCWSKLAEICSQLLFKGRKVYVEGRLQTRKWTGQDGMERETTEVVIDNMIALGAPKGSSGGQSYSSQDDYGDDYGSGGYAMTDDPKAQMSDDELAADIKESAKASEAEEKSKSESTTTKSEEVDEDDIPF